MTTRSSIIDQYDEEAKETYRDFTKSLRDLIFRLLESEDIAYHTLTSRTKSRQSLVEKIRRKSDKYDDLTEITDLTGLRVILLFEEEIDPTADLIEREFNVDWENSVDKRYDLSPNQFGYISLHYVFELDDKRLSKPEYSNFEGLKAEIQIRSILQHAWAQIEHELGAYKDQAVTEENRRHFSRLAGLLEIADREFNELREREAESEQQSRENVRDNTSEMAFDKDSLKAAIYEDENIIQDLDGKIADRLGLSGDDIDRVVDEKMLNGLAVRLQHAPLTTVEELLNELEQHAEELPAFVAEFLSDSLNFSLGEGDKALEQGMVLYYLPYFSIVDQADGYEEAKTELANYLVKFDDFPEDPDVPSLRDLASTIVDNYRASRSGA